MGNPGTCNIKNDSSHNSSRTILGTSEFDLHRINMIVLQVIKHNLYTQFRQQITSINWIPCIPVTQIRVLSGKRLGRKTSIWPFSSYETRPLVRIAQVIRFSAPSAPLSLNRTEDGSNPGVSIYLILSKILVLSKTYSFKFRLNRFTALSSKVIDFL